MEISGSLLKSSRAVVHCPNVVQCTACNQYFSTLFYCLEHKPSSQVNPSSQLEQGSPALKILFLHCCLEPEIREYTDLLKSRICNIIYSQGTNARKVNCGCVYSAYILKPVLLGGICKQE